MTTKKPKFKPLGRPKRDDELTPEERARFDAVVREAIAGYAHDAAAEAERSQKLETAKRDIEMAIADFAHAWSTYRIADAATKATLRPTLFLLRAKVFSRQEMWAAQGVQIVVNTDSAGNPIRTSGRGNCSPFD